MRTLPIEASSLNRRAAQAFELVNILGVQIDCVRKDELVDQARLWAGGKSPRTILYVNAHCLNIASKDAEHRAVLNQADLVYADGASMVLASRMLGGCSLQKLTGRIWISDFCETAAAGGLRLFILAGRPGVAQLASETLHQKWPELQIVGTNDGYFSAKTETEVLADIAAAKPHILFVGMNTPRQEKWVAAHRSEIAAPVCWAVGALFDFVAGSEPPVPDWMNALYLEWFWRLLMDPRGKWRRYLVGNPLFLTRLLRQRLGR